MGNLLMDVVNIVCAMFVALIHTGLLHLKTIGFLLYDCKPNKQSHNCR